MEGLSPDSQDFMDILHLVAIDGLDTNAGLKQYTHIFALDDVIDYENGNALDAVCADCGISYDNRKTTPCPNRSTKEEKDNE